MIPDYKQAQREAESASRMVYRPQAGTKSDKMLLLINWADQGLR